MSACLSLNCLLNAIFRPSGDQTGCAASRATASPAAPPDRSRRARSNRASPPSAFVTQTWKLSAPAPATPAVLLSSDSALERDRLAVGRPRRSEVAGAVAREAALPAAVGVHDPDLPVALEGDPPTVGRPDRFVVSHRVTRQPSQSAPVGVHDVDLRVVSSATHAAYEGDPSPVRRPSRRIIKAADARQPPLRSAVGVHNVDPASASLEGLRYYD
jgi:hypothetical protein